MKNINFNENILGENYKLHEKMFSRLEPKLSRMTIFAGVSNFL